MALAATLVLLSIALLAVDRAAAAGIKLWTPPNEEYFGDPDAPGGPLTIPWLLGGRVGFLTASVPWDLRLSTATAVELPSRAGIHRAHLSSQKRPQLVGRRSR
jgi:hypothetical protein